jgi:hypothetical protein
MPNRIKIYEKTTGPLLQHEEWWFLVPGTDGGATHVMVEHYSINPSSKAPATIVRRKLPVDEVLAQADEVADALQAALDTGPRLKSG